METMEDQSEVKFTYCQIYKYITDGKYTEILEKCDKLVCRKRSQFSR